jgi:SAM-dependent methyltransferase
MADQPPAGTPDHTSSFALNLANWDEAAPVHAASADYGVARFAEDPAHLSEVVRFDLPRLGDVHGLDGVHLQCHIGTDTVSLARLGARMTGLDFSPAAVAEATRLAASAGADVTFVQGNVYDAVELLGRERFDLVFTGVGALCWLPDIRRWAGVVDGLLRPGGRLFLREGHPVLWALDYERKDGLVALETPYFEHAEPVVDVDDGTYVETGHVFANTVTHSWNRGLGEIVTALLDRGLVLTMLEEHDSVPWEALPGSMVRGELDEWRLADRPRRLTCTYTLQATKPAP